MYKHFVWDFDGTLFNTYPAMVSLLVDMLKEIGKDAHPVLIEKEMRMSMAHALRYCEKNYGINDDFIEDYSRRRQTYDVLHSAPYPDIFEICEAIAKAGKFNYLYTHRGENAILMLEKFGLKDFFRESLTAEKVTRRKPDPQGMYYLIDKYQLVASEILMIGDRDLDIMAGKNAGTDGCFYSETGEINANADWNITDFKAIYQWL